MTLRLGIVGCGDIATFTTLFARLNRGIAVAACCDISAERVAQFARRFRIPQQYTAYENMLAQADLDAVYLAVPHHLHYPMLLQAIASDKPAFVEKPVTRTLAEGIEIARLSAENNVKIAVNYQYRYDKGCYALARAVQRGDLGAIESVRVDLPWSRQAGYFENASWHTHIATAGGGTLITQGSHFLDIALWALGERPLNAIGNISKRRFPDVEVEDTAHGEIETESGAVIVIDSTMAADKERGVTIEVVGERGSATYSNRPIPHVRFRGLRAKKERPPQRGIHALQRSIEGFRAWVVDDEPYLTPAHEALPVLAAVEAVYESAETGQPAIIKPEMYGESPK
jgi:predicted dehydrogenase